MAGKKWNEVDYYQDERDVKALQADFKFPDFTSALEFVNKVGKLAEEANHHPDINLSWGHVRVWLTTHDAHGITEKDRKLAEEISKL